DVPFFRRSNSCSNPYPRVEESVIQLQRLDDFAMRQLDKTHARHSLEQEAQRDEAQIAVNNVRARRVFESFTGDRRDSCVSLSFCQYVERPPRRQSRGVSQEFANSDRVLVRAIEFRQVV